MKALLFLLALLLGGPCARAADLLDPEQAFRFSARAVDDGAVEVRFAIAEGYYRSALQTDPNYGPALFGLGVVRQVFNSVQEAVDLYTKDIAIEPTNAAAHYNLGILLRIQGKTAQGDAEIARAIQLDPKLPQPPAPTPTPKPASPTPTR